MKYRKSNMKCKPHKSDYLKELRFKNTKMQVYVMKRECVSVGCDSVGIRTEI